VYAGSGNAIYALERYGNDAFVTVIARPYGLPVRLFPVANSSARLSDGADSSLVVLERTASSASARTLTCSSPLIAVQPYSDKRPKYVGVGQAYTSVVTAQDPPPPPTGDQC
jgi:hypothetical protein